MCEAETHDVLGLPITAVKKSELLGFVEQKAAEKSSAYVCFCNANSIDLAQKSPGYRSAIEEADLAVADGVSVVAATRLLHKKRVERLPGPEIMSECCSLAAKKGFAVFFYGSTEQVLEGLGRELSARWPDLDIAGRLAPPFDEMHEAQQEDALGQLSESGAAIIFVGLGAPKQEIWMAQQRGRLPAVMLGVGAAFDFHSGMKRRAPAWMRRTGLEWLHRLLSEPRRLWRRYLLGNLRFVRVLMSHYLQRRAKS